MLNTAVQEPTQKKSAYSLVVWAAFASFSTYFCMYGFRKPMSSATFDGERVFGISFKSALVIAQVFGYMAAKFLGIKFISEINKAKRAVYILTLIGSAHLSLLLLALIPKPFNIIFLFTNGLCLGLIWGLVFSFIEGRKFTDFLALILSTNFIFSSGVAKSLGRACIEYWHVREIFMPFVAGLFYIPLLLLSVWMLTKIPPPSATEINSRGVRVSLNGKERLALFKKFLVGLVAITVLNLLLTILRDVKDNYAVEILRTVKPSFNPAIFTQMETIAAVTVLGLLLFLTGFKDHFKSIVAHHLAILSGLLIVLMAAIFLKLQLFDPVINLILYTIGLYVCYNTLQCLFLDRFIAAFRVKGNIGFFFYFMDSIGYLGSCFIIFNKEIFSPKLNWLNYFLQVSFILGIIGIISIIVSWFYFRKKYQSLNYNVPDLTYAQTAL
jgi:MFS family permease